MAIFNSDLEAIVYIIIIAIALFTVHYVFSTLFKKINKITPKFTLIFNFIFRISILLVLIYLIIEGFPSFKEIDPAYQAILTGAISTALAFASSGIFSNLVSGIVLFFIRPFEIGDLVKIEGDKGIVRTISLSRVVIETFDYILVEKANSRVITAPIVNYTIKLRQLKNFQEFIDLIKTPAERGLFSDTEEAENNYDNELKMVFNTLKKKKPPHHLYTYTFRMHFPYRRFRIILQEVEGLCENLKADGNFLIAPRFHIIDFTFRIVVKFRILTFNSEKIFDYQSDLTQGILKIISKHA